MTAIPPIDGVVETVLYADDLDRAVAFYRDVLGLTPLEGDGVRFQAFDSGARRVLLLFVRGGTLEAVPAPVGMIPPHDGCGPLHVGSRFRRPLTNPGGNDSRHSGFRSRARRLGIAAGGASIFAIQISIWSS